jgi:undecaprenyl pyrophosphate phosphatase UppP
MSTVATTEPTANVAAWLTSTVATLIATVVGLLFINTLAAVLTGVAFGIAALMVGGCFAVCLWVDQRSENH